MLNRFCGGSTPLCVGLKEEDTRSKVPFQLPFHSPPDCIHIQYSVVFQSLSLPERPLLLVGFDSLLYNQAPISSLPQSSVLPTLKRSGLILRLLDTFIRTSTNWWSAHGFRSHATSLVNLVAFHSTRLDKCPPHRLGRSPRPGGESSQRERWSKRSNDKRARQVDRTIWQLSR